MPYSEAARWAVSSWIDWVDLSAAFGGSGTGGGLTGAGGAGGVNLAPDDPPPNNPEKHMVFLPFVAA
jgi:hypothetical protein